ncbi:MAG TPA: signal peptidase II [Candidatus Acidoferrales bacterium]|nr:signal peptidase II [Candidatus Acidoferrales bacterium]
MTRTQPWPFWTGLAAIAVFALDRATKFWVSHSLTLGEKLFANWPVHIYYTINSGAAFSILPDADWLFLAVAVTVVVVIAWKWRLLALQPAWVQAGVGLLLGGALANAVDRLTQGYVVDFIEFPHWPIFNVADSGITVGVVILVIRITRAGRTSD